MTKLYIVVNVDWFFLSHRKRIAQRALEEGYDVTIVTKDTGRRAEIESLGVKFINLPINPAGTNPLQEIRLFIFLYNLYRREKPDIVHHVGLKSMLWGTMAAKYAKVKAVVNAVSGLGIIFTEGYRTLLSSVLPSLLKKAHQIDNLAVIFQNNEDKEKFLKNGIVKESQCYYIKGSGVDLQEFAYTPEPETGKVKVMFAARMIEEKGVFVLTDAANKLRDKYKVRVQFILCGMIDSNPKSIKKVKLEAVCDGEYIKWLGHRTDILNLLQKSHIVAFPSYYKEGLPKSLIEAAAVGRPIITTDATGCRDTVEDGYNGYLVPIKDSDALAEKLAILIDNKQLRVEMGRHSRALAERDFSLDDVVAKHLAIYRALVP